MATTVVDHPAARRTGPGRLGRPARRIASLLPSATEIVCALGLADRLVAVTHECDHPPDLLAGIPRTTANRLPPDVRGSREIDAAVRTAVGDAHGIYDLDADRLRDLAPDLVLTQELCRVCAVAYPTVVEAARLSGGAHDPVVVSLEPHTLDDVLATIDVVARLAGVPDRGAGVVDGLRQRLAGVPVPAAPRRVAVIEWLDPLFAPGHWVPEQIARAGGMSVVGTPAQPSREIEWDRLEAAEPDIVVLGLCGFDLAATLREWAAFRAPPALRATRAWRDGELWAIDGSAYVSRPGPRLVEGIEILSAVLNGQPDGRAVRLLAVPA